MIMLRVNYPIEVLKMKQILGWIRCSSRLPLRELVQKSIPMYAKSVIPRIKSISVFQYEGSSSKLSVETLLSDAWIWMHPNVRRTRVVMILSLRDTIIYDEFGKSMANFAQRLAAKWV